LQYRKAVNIGEQAFQMSQELGIKKQGLLFESR